MNFFNPYATLSSMSRRTYAVATFCLLLLTWSLISYLDIIGANKLPSPLAIVKAFSYLSWDNGHSLLLQAAAGSLYRIFIATLLVIVVGLPIGILMGASPKINSALAPIIDPFRSAPIAALLPLFVMWFGIDQQMKIIFLFVAAVVYLIPMVRDAMISVSYSYWEAARDLGATHVECILKGVLPIAAPRIFDAVIVAMSIQFTYVTVSELVNADSGLGQLIQNARRFSAMDQVIAGIITIMVIALVTQLILSKIRARLFFWESR